MADDVEDLRKTFRDISRDLSRELMEKSYAPLHNMMDKLDDSISENRDEIQNLEESLEGVNLELSGINEQLNTLNVYAWRSLGVLGKILHVMQDAAKNNKGFLDLIGKSLGANALAGGAKSALPKAALGAGLLGAGALAAPAIADSLKGENKPVEGSKDASKIESPKPMSGDKELAKPDAEKIENKDSEYVKRQKQATDEYQRENEKIAAKYPDSGSKDKMRSDTDGLINSLKQKYNVDKFPLTREDSGAEMADLPSARANDAMLKLDRNEKSEEIKKLQQDLVYKAGNITFDAGSINFSGTDRDRLSRPSIASSIPSAGISGAPSAPPSPDGSKSDGPKTDGEKKGFTGENIPGFSEIHTKSGKKTLVASSDAPRFQGFVDDLEATGYKIDELGGRSIRKNVNNPSKMSKHSFGQAIDINWSRNPNRSTQTDMPVDTVEQLIKKHGLGWGYNWKSVKDPMHFSSSPEEGATQPSGASTDTKSLGGPQSAPTPSGPATSSADGPPKNPQASMVKAPAAPAISGSTINDVSKKSEVASVTTPNTTVNNVKNVAAPAQKNNVENKKLMDSRVAGRVEPEDAATRYRELFGMGVRDYANPLSTSAA